jgi:chemotaxis protein methyltransferase CheR
MSTDVSDAKCEISDELYELFAGHIYTIAGIKLNRQKKILLQSRLQKRLKALNLRTYQEYYERVLADENECSLMLNCVSTNTTKFFRENHHFDYLMNTVIPGLLKEKVNEKIIRIWSAGCSTGEEPYTIAMTVYDAMAGGLDPGLPLRDRFSGWDIKILATDISTRVLDTARAGIYDRDQLPESMQHDGMARFFLNGIGGNSGKIKVKDFVADIIRFGQLNFKDSSYPFHRPFDVIFFRNVMIYFDDAMKNHVISKFHQHLAPEGHLFLGHSETLFDRTMFQQVSLTVYRKL